MNSAVAVAVVMGSLGLLGTTVAALFARKGTVETNVTHRLELALDNQAAQIERAEGRIERQGKRIVALEQEVRACHDSREDDRQKYAAELDELRRQIGGTR